MVHKKKRGFTLIETLIYLVLSTIFIMSLATGYQMSITAIKGQERSASNSIFITGVYKYLHSKMQNADFILPQYGKLPPSPCGASPLPACVNIDKQILTFFDEEQSLVSSALIYPGGHANEYSPVPENASLNELAGYAYVGIFDLPRPVKNGMTYDGSNIYIADANKIIKCIAPGNCSVLTGSNSHGYQDGNLSSALFNNISAIEYIKIGGKDYIIVSEMGNRTIRTVNITDNKVETIYNKDRKDTSESNVVSTLASSRDIADISVYTNGSDTYIVLLDSISKTIRVIKNLTESYDVTTSASDNYVYTGYIQNISIKGASNIETSGAYGTNMKIYLADNKNYVTYQLKPSTPELKGVYQTYAGNNNYGKIVNGNRLLTNIGSLADLYLDNDTLYFSDFSNNVIGKIENGNVSIIAGNYKAGVSNDGVQALNSIFRPTSIIKIGNIIYFKEEGTDPINANYTPRIRTIDLTTGNLGTFNTGGILLKSSFDPSGIRYRILDENTPANKLQFIR